MYKAALATACVLLSSLASAATFDSEPAKQPRWDLSTANFRLRLPDGDTAPKRFRGILVVVPEQDHDGRELVKEQKWQDLADRWQFALLGVHLEGGSDYSIAPNGSGPALLAALKDLARQSGHPELEEAPLAVWGHGAGGLFGYCFSCWKPERTIAFVSVKGGYFRATVTPMFRHVPGLFFAGEKDTDVRRTAIHKLVSDNRKLGAHWCEAIEPGGNADLGHTHDLSRVFLDEEVIQRLPPPDRSGAVAVGNGYVHLLEEEEGRSWLGDPAGHAVASFDKFTGPKGNAAWLPDETAARAWSAFTSGSPVEPLRASAALPADGKPPLVSTAPARIVPPASAPVTAPVLHPFGVPAVSAPPTAPRPAVRTARLLRAVAMPAMQDGRPIGTITLAPGAVVNVVSEQAGKVTVGYQGGTATVDRMVLDLPAR